MANSTTHFDLPYPIRKARFSLEVPYLDADGDPTDPTTPDTEISKDAAAYADCTEEVSTITGSNGSGYLTLTGAEMDCALAFLAAKVASGPKNTLASLRPRQLPIVSSGTLSAGSSTGGTLGTILGYDITGCFIRSTGGTGGGGTGGANNQARKILTYNTSTGVFTCATLETAFDGTTTYDILLPDGMTLGALLALNPATAGRKAVVSSTGVMDSNLAQILGTALTETAGLIAAGFKKFFNVASPTGTVNSLADAVPGTAGGGFIAGANAATSITTALTANVVGNITGNLSGSVGSLTTNNDKTGYGLSAAAVQAIWDALTSALSTAGSIGKKLVDNITGVLALDATVAKAATVATAANQTTILSKLLKYTQLILRKDAAIATDNAAEVTAINADGGSGAGGFANNTDSQEAIRDNMGTAQTGDAFAIVNDAAFGNAKLVRSTTPANTLDVSATGEAGLDFNNVKDATAGHTLTNITVPTVTTAVNLTTNNDKTGYGLSAASVTAIWAYVVEGTHTAVGYMRLFASALVGILSGAATTTVTIKDADNTKTRITATVDANGNRSAVTTDET